MITDTWKVMSDHGCEGCFPNEQTANDYAAELRAIAAVDVRVVPPSDIAPGATALAPAQRELYPGVPLHSIKHSTYCAECGTDEDEPHRNGCERAAEDRECERADFEADRAEERGYRSFDWDTSGSKDPYL